MGQWIGLGDEARHPVAGAHVGVRRLARSRNWRRRTGPAECEALSSAANAAYPREERQRGNTPGHAPPWGA